VWCCLRSRGECAVLARGADQGLVKLPGALLACAVPRGYRPLLCRTYSRSSSVTVSKHQRQGVPAPSALFQQRLPAFGLPQRRPAFGLPHRLLAFGLPHRLPAFGLPHRLPASHTLTECLEPRAPLRGCSHVTRRAPPTKNRFRSVQRSKSGLLGTSPSHVPPHSPKRFRYVQLRESGPFRPSRAARAAYP
jgi:hypothetical protein